ncbi:MAG TPA: DNA polymerase III subunit beta, partial [Polyangiaceae bacterium]
CQAVADKKSTMPMLGNVLLEANAPDQLRLLATDLQLSVAGKIAAKVESGGSVAVGAREMLERIRMMPEGQVSVSTDGGSTTTVRSVGSARRYTLHGLPGDEFPALPQPEPQAVPLELEVDALLRLISGTYFSISTDETRPHLSSALFEWEGQSVRMVTTDGHRLSKMEIALSGKPANATLLIPLKGVLELKRLCEEFKGERRASGENAAPVLNLSQSGPNAFFLIDDFQFSVKLVDAQFPPYGQVIPETTEWAVRAPRLPLTDALKAVSIAANERTGGVKLTLSAGKMRFESESPDAGEGFDEVGVEYNGAEVTVGFNARYFLDVLTAIEDDEIILGLSGELDPATVKPATDAVNSRYLAVIMPMRI